MVSAMWALFLRLRNILLDLDYPERTAELAAIAGYLHDIGNSVSRVHHGPIAALLVAPILKEMQMPPADCAGTECYRKP